MNTLREHFSLDEVAPMLNGGDFDLNLYSKLCAEAGCAPDISEYARMRNKLLESSPPTTGYGYELSTEIGGWLDETGEVIA